MLLLNSQELVSASGLTLVWADECECTQPLSSLQLFHSDAGVCSRNKSRQRVGLSARHRLFLCLDLGTRVMERLPMLLAPVFPLCKGSACFSCKISHACKLLCQTSGLVTLGRLQSWTVAVVKTKWMDCWLLTGSKLKTHAEPTGLFVCFWAAFYLVPEPGNSACSSPPNQNFKLILTL